MTSNPTDPASDRFIGIADADVPIYRIEKRRHLPTTPDGWRLHLSTPKRFADPLEDLATWTAMTDRSSTPWEQHFYGNVLPRLYVQCWSLTEESDPLWRAYSYFGLDPSSNRNRFPDDEGVQIRSTPRKLLTALIEAAGEGDECFVGAVEYLPPDEVKQRIANEVGRAGRDAFGSAPDRVQQALLKRRAFDHEREVRLMLVRGAQEGAESVEVAIDPNKVFDAICLEPRLVTFEQLEREADIRARGYSGPVRVSELYQRVLLDVHVGK